MDQPYQQTNTIFNKFIFTGEGSRYFGIWAVNIILTIITLGLYYPWAKAAIRKFFWNETQLEDDRFVFHGTGKEMFRGFVIAYVIFASLIASIYIFPMGILIFYLGLFLLAPIAIFGGWRYRMSRTSWRGIHFSFKGKLGDFLKMYYLNLLLSITTLGIYASWMRVEVMKYLFGHTQLGNYKLDFVGEGGSLFGINILGGILFYPTLGIYSAWFMANRFNFTMENIVIHHENGSHRMISELKGSDVLKELLINIVLIFCTLGIAFPWIAMRWMRLYTQNIAIPKEVDLNGLVQREVDDYDDATGDDMMDILDVGLEF